ncbi:MAG TPA: alpha-glucuronidase family glycosyl hydrolase, partial [Asticcacaulis sp.]|nr:alpha-glucuronidase family glycosyl hydrolase [Asticcacaulis sp.]
MTYPGFAKIGLIFALLAPLPAAAHAEDGYDLWLRYRPLDVAHVAQYAPHATAVTGGDSPTLVAARQELQRAMAGMLGKDVRSGSTDGQVILGTPDNSPTIKALNLPLANLGPEGFLIRSVTVDGHPATVIAGNSDVGVLYGTFRFISLMQTERSLNKLDISDAPKIRVRVLDHWDNLDGSVERGYAGKSIWDWWRLPDLKDTRYIDYARADASVGINGVVLNNVNAKADSLTAPYIAKTQAVAAILRPYGIKVYLSARFSAPMELGGLKTADPLDPQVRAWWKAKADEIYAAIPDFGGFLVKANSEGQPGPGDYKRTHADGANMLAEAVAPHGGIVMWRAFVYSEKDATDRAKQAFNDFVPLDGKFAPNVIVQVKNGPIDFQPREPFHPMFGAMPHTRLMFEGQITKEYL